MTAKLQLHVGVQQEAAAFDELADWVRGVNLLYHEATYSDENSEKAALRGHSTTVQAAQCAARAGVKKLLVGHYSSSLTEEFLKSTYISEVKSIFPDSEMVNDGDIFEVV